MIKIFLLQNGTSVIGKQAGNDHARLLRMKDPLIFQYLPGQGKKWAMHFQAFDIVTNPREVRFSVTAIYNANEDQVRQYEDARAKMFETMETSNG